MQRLQRLHQGMFTPPDIRLTRVIGAIGQTDGNELTPCLLRQISALEQVLDGDGSYLFVAVAERSIFIDLVLKQVWVNGANADPVLLAKLHDFGGWEVRAEIPEDMNGHGRTNSGKGMDLPGVGELVIDIDGGCLLEEFPEPSTGIGESPTGCLDPKLIERLLDSFFLGFVHERERGCLVMVTNRRKGTSICLHITSKFVWT